MPYVLLVTFISMVFLRPMVEQIIYRYLIIHELGKVWNRQFVIGLSIVIETIVHVYDMASILKFFHISLLLQQLQYYILNRGII